MGLQGWGWEMIYASVVVVMTGLWNGDDFNEGRKRSRRSGFGVQESRPSYWMNVKSSFGWTEGP